jgi:hypothetical protein
MTDPLENGMVALLTEAGIRFTRPDQDATDPANLDFFLPDFSLYIEVKQFHSHRIAEQLSKVPERKSAIVLVGPNAIADFKQLVDALAKAPRPTVLPEILKAMPLDDLQRAIDQESAAFRELERRKALTVSPTPMS